MKIQAYLPTLIKEKEHASDAVTSRPRQLLKQKVCERDTENKDLTLCTGPELLDSVFILKILTINYKEFEELKSS